MPTLADLWLPILIAGVVVFFLSFLSWGVLPVHKGDMAQLPNEQTVIDAFRSWNLPQGTYFFPFMTPERKKDPAFRAEMGNNPSGLITVFGRHNMGLNMTLSFLVCVVISLFVAYLCAIALQKGAAFGTVFRFASAAGILGYAFGQLSHQIWFQANTSAKVAAMLEGIVFGLATGAVFAFLWPE